MRMIKIYVLNEILFILLIYITKAASFTGSQHAGQPCNHEIPDDPTQTCLPGLICVVKICNETSEILPRSSGRSFGSECNGPNKCDETFEWKSNGTTLITSELKCIQVQDQKKCFPLAPGKPAYPRVPCSEYYAEQPQHGMGGRGYLEGCTNGSSGSRCQPKYNEISKVTLFFECREILLVSEDARARVCIPLPPGEEPCSACWSVISKTLMMVVFFFLACEHAPVIRVMFLDPSI